MMKCWVREDEDEIFVERQTRYRNKSALCNADSSSKNTTPKLPDSLTNQLKPTNETILAEKAREIKEIIVENPAIADIAKPDYEWEADPKTQQLKDENKRLTSQNQNLSRKINDLGDQLDEANEKLELFRKIKIWAEDNDQWMFIKDEALREH